MGIGEIKNNPQVYTTQEGREEIKNNPQVYTTQEGIGEIKNNPQLYTTQESKEEIKNNPQVYTTQGGIGEIKNNPQVYTTREGIEEIKNNSQVYITQEGIEEIKINPQGYIIQEGTKNWIHASLSQETSLCLVSFLWLKVEASAVNLCNYYPLLVPECYCQAWLFLTDIFAISNDNSARGIFSVWSKAIWFTASTTGLYFETSQIHLLEFSLSN